jgi:hypothetical protein
MSVSNIKILNKSRNVVDVINIDHSIDKCYISLIILYLNKDYIIDIYINDSFNNIQHYLELFNDGILKTTINYSVI